MLRCAERLRAVQQVIVRRVRQSPTLVPDETGWRIGGVTAWLHVAVGVDATAYLIDRQRGYEAAAKLIGEHYSGAMTHDGWKPYDRFADAKHQTCLGHLLRRCHEMLQDTVGGAVIFPRQIKALLQESLAIRDQRDAGTLSPAQAAAQVPRLSAHMDDLLCRRRASAALQRLSDHLWNHRDHLFGFLLTPGIDATNHRAEQAIRPAVVNRKVCGGNRTPAGAAAQSILMSVLRTAKQRGKAALGFVSQTLRSRPGLGPSLFADTG
jgi:transposase